MRSGPKRAIIIEEFPTTANEISEALGTLGVQSVVFDDGEEAWNDLVQNGANFVFASLDIVDTGGEWFLEQLRDEWKGTVLPPDVFLVTEADQIYPELAELGPAGYLIPPIGQTTLSALLDTRHKTPDFPDQARRLRELSDLTLLGTDLFGAIDQLVVRVAQTFSVSDCVIWGPRHEPYWPRTARPLRDDADQDAVLHRCELALEAGSNTFVAVPGESGRNTVVKRAGQSFIAAPLTPPGGNELGGLALVADDSRQFSVEERATLRLFAKRLSLELAWVSAHVRLVSEHEKLRETALVDPLLGVWTRSAFEQSITTEIAGARRRQEPLALAVLDLVQLRQVNDRYGHLTGDAVLAHMAKVVRSNLRRQDLVGRFGGDELAILLVGTDLEGAETALDNIIEAVASTPFAEGGKEVQIKITCGLTAITAYERSGEKAFARALSANRRARKTHQALVVSDPNVDGISGDKEDDSVGNTEGLPHGSTLGGMYRILHEISRGAMGVVYRAEDLGLGRPVAIKVLRSDLAQNHDLVSRFREEAAMLASLRHRNLVNVYSFGSEDEEVYFVMELVEGESLKDILSRLKQRREKFDLQTLAKIVTEIAEALDQIHSVGIIHRDVKPSNILLDRINDRAVLVDVGVAKRREDRGDAAGTPGYAAPESFMDAQESSATDVYGLAATTYKALTGRAPFGGGQVEQVVRRQLSEKPIPPSSRRPGISPSVDKVLLKALHPDQEHRYQDATAFASAFVRSLAQRPDEDIPDEVPTRVVRMHSEPVSAVDAAAAAAAARPPRADRTDTSVATLLPSAPATYRLAQPISGSSVSSSRSIAGHSRGALFRVASKLLGHRLGSTWVRRLAESSASLAEVLQPTLSPMSWQPVETLVALLERTSGRVRDPRELARTLGRTTMSATFARFFGADPSTLTPAALLKAAEAYWSRYHTWGHVRVVDDGVTSVVATITECPRDPLIAALIEGALGRIAELAGAVDVTVVLSETAVDGQHAFRFAVKWREERREQPSKSA